MFSPTHGDHGVKLGPTLPPSGCSAGVPVLGWDGRWGFSCLWGGGNGRGCRAPRNAGGKDTSGSCPRQDTVSGTPLLQQEEEAAAPRDEGLGVAGPQQARQVPEGKLQVPGSRAPEPRQYTGWDGPGHRGPVPRSSRVPQPPSQQVGPGG